MQVDQEGQSQGSQQNEDTTKVSWVSFKRTEQNNIKSVLDSQF